MTRLGPLLRAARGVRSISEVERDAAIAHSIVSKAERGEILPSLPTLHRLATHYGYTHELERWITALEGDRIDEQRRKLATMGEGVVPIRAARVA